MPKKFSLAVIVKLVGPLLLALSPALRDMVDSSVNNWMDKAQKTESPFDDMFIQLIADLLGIEID